MSSNAIERFGARYLQRAAIGFGPLKVPRKIHKQVSFILPEVSVLDHIRQTRTGSGMVGVALWREETENFNHYINNAEFYEQIVQSNQEKFVRGVNMLFNLVATASPYSAVGFSATDSIDFYVNVKGAGLVWGVELRF